MSEPAEEVSPSGRDARGQFVKGHTESIKTGDRSPRVLAGVLPEQAEARAIIRAMRAGIETDLGGADTLSNIHLDTIDSYCGLKFLEEHLMSDVLQRGVLTTKGKQRVVVTTLLSVIDRKIRLASIIGLDRKARDTQRSTRDWIEAAEVERS